MVPVGIFLLLAARHVAVLSRHRNMLAHMTLIGTATATGVSPPAGQVAEHAVEASYHGFRTSLFHGFFSVIPNTRGLDEIGKN
jgi:hypothetical protein